MEPPTRARRRRIENGAQSSEIYGYVPEEIVRNILPKLPVRSLLRFRCVSKQWSCSITETKPNRHKLLVKSMTQFGNKEVAKQVGFPFLSIDQKLQFESVGKYNSDGSEKQWSFEGHDIEFMGSCNGLLLIREFEDLFLLNPSTRYCKKVLWHDKFGQEDYYTVAGLYMDSHNEYKALVAFSHTTPRFGGEFVSVGCFKTKTWTNIRFAYRVSTAKTGPTVNNQLHWLASKKSATNDLFERHNIIYFDTETNAFVELPMPASKDTEGDIVLGLGVLDGCLCMARSKPRRYNSDVQILVMKEYGAKESWTNLFVIKYYRSSVLMPFFYTEKKGEVLMGPKERGKDVLFKYDIKSGRNMIVKYLEEGEDVIVYEETLVRPMGFDDSNVSAQYEDLSS